MQLQVSVMENLSLRGLVQRNSSGAINRATFDSQLSIVNCLRSVSLHGAEELQGFLPWVAVGVHGGGGLHGSLLVQPHCLAELVGGRIGVVVGGFLV